MAASAMLAELHGDDDFLVLARAVGEFADRELTPYVRNLGREEFPARFVSMAGQAGFLGTAIPTEYGGQGGSLEALASVLEGIAACDGSLALTLAAHESLATTHILLGGQDEHRRTYLPELTAGRKIGAWCLTEPQAGSNIFSDTRTKLVKRSAGWVLSGEKTFITNGCHADLYVVLARAVLEDGRNAGMTACVVERRGNEGRIQASPLHGKMGMTRSDTAALRFDAVPVADESILGPVGSGDKVARRVLLRGRVGIGALALGLARDSLERAVVYARGRNVAGGSLYEQPLTRAKLARMEGDLWVAWQAVRSAAEGADQARPFKLQACMAKIFATEVALHTADEAVQILGGYGYMGDYKVEQNYRDARLLTIGEGATEILRFAIAGNLLDGTTAGDILELPECPVEGAVQEGGAENPRWGSSWRALQLAAEALAIVREHFEREHRSADGASAAQCPAAAFADLATKFWVAKQAMAAGTAFLNRGAGSQKQRQLIRSFLNGSAVEICHRSSEYLRMLGLADARLHRNYSECVWISTGATAPVPQPLPVERP